MTTAAETGTTKGKAAPAQRHKGLFLKQPMMLKVLAALAPVLVTGIYFFGWRVLALLATTTVVGLATEWAMSRRRGAQVSLACFVTTTLLALSLPPTLPLWMAAVGAFVAILFAKEVFGGFGRNFANPAITGRLFIYVAFPREMTGAFVPAFRGWPGGFARWSFASMDIAPAWLSSAAQTAADAVTAATPAWVLRDFGHAVPLKDLFLGSIGGVFTDGYHTQHVLAAGSIGEVCAPVLILAGLYLMLTKTANWRLTLSMVAAAVGLQWLLNGAFGIEGTVPAMHMLLGGSLLYGAVFMVTDPISAPRQKPAMFVYGAFIGAMIVLFRWKGQFAGALSFSILLGNVLSPTLDMIVKAWNAKRKAKASGAAKAVRT